MLVKLSSAITKTDEKHIDMLRVLYTDLVIAKTDLEAAESAYDLFKLLIAPGILKPTDISVLFETIEITGFRYLKEIIETYETYPSEVKLTRFSEHRQNVVDLGRRFSVKDVQRLSQLYRGNRPFANQWKLIEDLETDVLTEDNMSTFLQCLREHDVNKGSGEASTSKRKMSDKDTGEASTSKRQMLEKGSGESSTSKRNMSDKDIGEASTSKRQMLQKGYGEASTSKRQMSEKDVIIRDFLTRRQKNLYQDVNLMTPTIWHEDHEVDIAQVFTELVLMQSTKKDRKSKAISSFIKFKGRSTSLNEVLDVIKSTESCKVLITGKGGMGKTTLLRYIAYQWASDGVYNAFANKLLFLINIRDIKANESFYDIMTKKFDLKALLYEHNLPADAVEAFLVINADKIVILLDGYDELERGAKDPINLFEGTELEKCTVLMSSRPDSTVKLIKCCDVHIKVKGFSRRNIKKYIHNHFHSLCKAEMGMSLISEFGLNAVVEDDNDEDDSNDYDEDDSYDYDDWDVDQYHYKNLNRAFELCSSPLLLLMICDIWHYRQCLPSDLSGLFKELFCAFLNQYQNRGGIKHSISQFDRIPEIYTDAIQVLGECMYGSLKENKLSIDKYILSKIAKNEKLVCLALKLGFVYKDSPVLPGDNREIYTTPHKLISEALAGFYLFKQIKKGSLKADEYEVIRCNKFLHMTSVFTVGFLGANDACILLKHWLIGENFDPQPFIWSNYSLTADNLEKFVESVGENETLNFKRIDMSRIDLSSISGRTLAFLCKISTHLIHIDMSHCSISGSIINEMMEECCRMNVALKDNMLSLDGNNLSDIDGKSLAKLVSVINHLDDDDDDDEFRWGYHSLTADNLEKLVESISENETLNWKRINMSGINLSSISGRTLACLCKISTHLIHIDMRHCSISGSIINEMMEECCRMKVELKDNMLSLNGNNLSDIDSKSLAKLLEVIYCFIFKWSDYSLAANNLEKLVESIGGNETLNLKRIDMSGIDLSSISGRTLACLCKISTHLTHIDMTCCNLSFSIINEMMEECRRMNVALKDNILRLKGNNLSDIDGKSLANLVSVINHCGDSFRGNNYSYRLRERNEINPFGLRDYSDPQSDITFKWSDYSLTANNLDKLVESVGENETLNWKRIDMSGINLSSISGRTLACLCKISTHLIHVDMSHCTLSGSIIHEMMGECCRMNVVLKDNLLSLGGNNLSDIDGKSLAKLLEVIYGFTFKWSDYSLTANNLDKLVESIGENETLNLKRIDMSRINLSSISGRTLAFLCKISTQLIHIDMSHCSISGSIINEMMDECCRMNVTLKDNMLRLDGNNLSYIDGKSLAKLVSVINHREDSFRENNYSYRLIRRNEINPFGLRDYSDPQPDITFKWSDYSLTANNLDKLVESIGENETLNLKRIDMSSINLSSISGRTLACLCKVSTHLTIIDMSHCSISGSIINEMMEEYCKMHETHVRCKLTKLDTSNNNLVSINGRTLACLCKVFTHLTHIDMSHCNLSGSIINEMMEECCRMNVVLKDNMLSLEGNNLSDIDGKSLAKLVSVINHRDDSFRGDNYSYCLRERNEINPLGLRDYSDPQPDITFKWSDYSLTANNLDKLVESIGENETLNLKRIDVSRINLSSISGRTLAFLCKISTQLIHIDMRHCSISGSIINEMMEECRRMNVALKDNILSLKGNNLSDIDGKSLARLVSVINHCDDPFRGNNYSYRLRERNEINPLGLRDYSDPQPDITFKWSDYSLTANNLDKLVESIGENETLNLKRIDMSRINLSSISGRTLAFLCKISTQLIHIDMRHCSISSSIINEMMEECHRMNVVLKDNLLSLGGNNLSDIDGKSLAKLLEVIYGFTFKWSDYSLTANNLEKLVESIGRNETLNLKRIDMSGINLSSVSGRTLACLCKISTQFIHIDMSDCNLSGSIINEMMEECCRMNVVLKDNMFSLKGNDLSDIDGKSLAKLVSVISHPDHDDNFIWSDYSLTADNLEKLVESMGKSETLNWKMIDMSEINLSSVSGRTLACLCKISTQLIHIDMSHCSLSGSIINEMMEECCRMNVVLKDNMFSLMGNDLSDIDGKLLAKLVHGENEIVGVISL
ncbi:uncharacterized protein LOC117125276 [Anneissia japonica]|uniref:uncharacterized protein LOC117125276 n=1 Tax=Anneissia japonica TaxID=1529436 RepID=UPI0014259E22|nr:uncharacterized protein LOC117125276 [Anneissia japonica]